MRNSAAAVRNAPLIRATSDAIIAAIEVAGAAVDPVVVMASLGCVVGSVASVSADPEAALAAMIAVARGVMDGSLLDGARDP